MGDEADDDLEKLFGAPPTDQTRSAERPGLLRRFVGRPRMWACVTTCVLGVAWIVLAAIEPATWRFVLGGLYLALGGLQLAVAVSDRRNRRGIDAPAGGDAARRSSIGPKG